MFYLKAYTAFRTHTGDRFRRDLKRHNVFIPFLNLPFPLSFLFFRPRERSYSFFEYRARQTRHPKSRSPVERHRPYEGDVFRIFPGYPRGPLSVSRQPPGNIVFGFAHQLRTAGVKLTRQNFTGNANDFIFAE